MTTFQDPPPQSRRSARQNERGEQKPTGEFGQFAAGAVPTQPFFEQPQAADPAAAPADAAAAAPTTGRRARPTGEPNLYEVPPEPLNYTTQGREPTPPTPVDYGTPSPQEPAPYRVRDFSPESATSGRRAAAPPLVEPTAYATYPQQGATDLEYRTQASPAGYPPVATEPEGQTLSRRELRQRLAEAETGASAPAVAAPGANPAQPPAFDPAMQAPPVAQPVAAPPVQPAPVQVPPPALQIPPAPPTLRPGPPPGPVQPTALSNAMAEFEALTRNGQLPGPAVSQRVAEHPVVPIMEPEVEHTGGWVAPAGHWSRQADLDDETQPWESTITREVGGGNVATTTSALVLPEIPRANPYPTALDSTGEVLLTGSIDLPRSLGSSGGDSRQYDDSRVDLMFDSQDGEFTGTDSSPVRAIRAVSTHTSGRGVIHANKPKGNRLVMVVFIATAVLAVGVVGMLAVGLALHLF